MESVAAGNTEGLEDNAGMIRYLRGTVYERHCGSCKKDCG